VLTEENIKIPGLEQTVSICKSQIEALESELMGVKQRNTALIEENSIITVLSGDLSVARDSADSYAIDLAALRNELHRVCEEKAVAESSLENTMAQLEALQQQHSQMEVEFAAAIDFAAGLQTLQSAKALLHETDNELRQKLALATTTAEASLRDKFEAESKMRVFAIENTTLKEENEQLPVLRQDLAASRAMVLLQEDRMKNLVYMNRVLAEENDDLVATKAENQELKDEVFPLRAELDRVTTENSQHLHSIEESCRQISNLDLEIQGLRMQLDEAVKKIAAYKAIDDHRVIHPIAEGRELGVLLDMSGSAMKTIGELDVKLKASQDDVTGKNAFIKQLESQLEEVRQELQTVQSQLLETDGALEKALENISQLEIVKTNLTNVIAHNDEDIAQLKAEKSQLSDDKAGLLADKASLIDNLAASTQLNMERAQMIATLESEIELTSDGPGPEGYVYVMTANKLSRQLEQSVVENKKLSAELYASTTFGESLQEELEKTRNNHQEELKRLTNNYQEELDSTRNRLQGELETTRKNLEEELATTRSKLQGELESTKATLRNTQSELKETIQQLDAVSKILKALQIERDETVQRMKQEYQDTVETLRRNSQAEIDNLRSNYHGDIDRLRTRHDDEINSLRKNYQEEVDYMKKTYRHEVETMRDVHANQISSMKVTHSDELSGLRANHALEVETLNSNYRGEVMSMASNHLNEVLTNRTNHKNEVETLVSNHQSEVLSMRTAHDATQCSLQQQLEHAIAKYEEDVAALKNAHSIEVESISSLHKQEIQAIELKAEREASTHRAEMESVMTVYVSERDRLIASHQAERDQAILSHQAEMAFTIASHQAERDGMISSYQSQRENMIASYQAERDESNAAHQAERDQMIASHQAERDESNTAHKAERDQMIASHQSERDQMIASHQSERDESNAAHKAERDQMIASHQSERDESNAAHKAERDQMIASHQSERDESNAAHKAERDQMIASHLAEREQMVGAHQAERDQMVAAHLAERDQMISERDQMVSTHLSETQLLITSHQYELDELITALADTRAAHKAELLELNSSHSTEVTSLATRISELEDVKSDLINKNQTLSRNLEMTQAALSDVEAAHENCDTNISYLQSECSRQKEELYELNDRKQVLERQVAQQQGRVGILDSLLNQFESKYSIVLQDRNSKAVTIEQLQSDLAASMQQNTEKDASIEELTADKEELKNVITEQASEITKLQDDLSLLETNHRIACEERDRNILNLADRNAQLTAANISISNLSSEKEDALEKIKELEAMTQDMESHISYQKQSIEGLNAEAAVHALEKQKIAEKQKVYDAERIAILEKFEEFRLADEEMRNQVMRMKEQRKLSDPWGFSREAGMGYRRFGSAKGVARPQTENERETTPVDIIDPVNGSAYRGIRGLRSASITDPETAEGDDAGAREHPLSAAADELILGSVPSRNFVAAKALVPSPTKPTTLPLIVGRNQLVPDVLSIGSQERKNRPASERSSGRRFPEELEDFPDDDIPDVIVVPIVRKHSSSKLPPPTRPQEPEFEKLFFPRNPNKPAGQQPDPYAETRRAKSSDSSQPGGGQRVRLQDSTKLNKPRTAMAAVTSKGLGPTIATLESDGKSGRIGEEAADAAPSPLTQTRLSKIPKKVNAAGRAAAPSGSPTSSISGNSVMSKGRLEITTESRHPTENTTSHTRQPPSKKSPPQTAVLGMYGCRDTSAKVSKPRGEQEQQILNGGPSTTSSAKPKKFYPEMEYDSRYQRSPFHPHSGAGPVSDFTANQSNNPDKNVLATIHAKSKKLGLY
jgi:chromosome segregation ATPase